MLSIIHRVLAGGIAIIYIYKTSSLFASSMQKVSRTLCFPVDCKLQRMIKTSLEILKLPLVLKTRQESAPHLNHLI